MSANPDVGDRKERRPSTIYDRLAEARKQREEVLGAKTADQPKTPEFTGKNKPKTPSKKAPLPPRPTPRKAKRANAMVPTEAPASQPVLVLETPLNTPAAPTEKRSKKLLPLLTILCLSGGAAAAWYFTNKDNELIGSEVFKVWEQLNVPTVAKSASFVTPSFGADNRVFVDRPELALQTVARPVAPAPLDDLPTAPSIWLDVPVLSDPPEATPPMEAPQLLEPVNLRSASVLTIPEVPTGSPMRVNPPEKLNAVNIVPDVPPYLAPATITSQLPAAGHRDSSPLFAPVQTTPVTVASGAPQSLGDVDGADAAPEILGSGFDRLPDRVASAFTQPERGPLSYMRPAQRAEVFRITMHVPREATVSEIRDLTESVEYDGFRINRLSPTDLTIINNQVRYYHARDAEEAIRLALALDAEARDFTSFSPKPPRGFLEIWISGNLPEGTTSIEEAALKDPAKAVSQTELDVRNAVFQSVR